MLLSQRIFRAGNWRGLALLSLLSLAGTNADAQTFRYSTLGTFNFADTYTDLNSSGTAISTTNTDDDNSAPQPIGFTFNFNGQDFTDFVLNTNGYIKLGSTAPSAPYYYEGAQSPLGGPINTASETNLILPFNLDLVSGSAPAEYRVATTGTAPNRVCTIQWKNVSDKARPATPNGPTIDSQYDNFAFQAKLYETTNDVEFVYNGATATAGTENFKLATVGLKGSGNAPGQSLVMQKGSMQDWSDAFAVAGNYPAPSGTSVAAHGIRKSVLPDAGRTYQFIRLEPNDAAVATIHTLGLLNPVAVTGHRVVAAIRNEGLNALSNIPVVLRVGGANTLVSTQTIPSLAPGDIATVTFDAYPTTLATGTNQISVAIPADDVTTNNVLGYTQVVGSGLSYSDQTPGVLTGPLIVEEADAELAVKYTTAPAVLNEVRLNFGASANNTSTYQIIIYDATGPGGNPGAVLFTSSTQTRTPAAGEVKVAVPNLSVSGSFYISLKQLTVTDPELLIQEEDPLREDAFFVKLASTGWLDLSDFNAPFRLGIGATLNTVTGSSAALARAVDVYPNPSNGQFSLAVRGAGANDGMQVEILNTLGQRVYTTTARDNFENKLDLSQLAAGLYKLKVSKGTEYMVRNITITK